MPNNVGSTFVVQNVISANRLYNYVSDAPTNRRYRWQWAVALKTSGTTFYYVNGKRILSDRNHPVILPKGSSYSWICTEPGECLLIEFEASYEINDVFSFVLSDTRYFVREFYKIQSALCEQTPEAKVAAFYSLYGILHQVLNSEEREYVSKDKMQLLQPALRYITEKYYDSAITNEMLAKYCGVSTVYFRKCFETAMGVSPIRYLHDFRIRQAKNILSSDFSTIAQVAESVGYNSVYHFSKMFKCYTGISPSEYAKASRK